MGQILEIASYSFNPYAIPNFIVSVFVLCLGAFVFSQNKKSTTHITFLFMSWSVVIWLFGFGMLYLANNDFTALWWARSAYIGVVFISTNIYAFSASYYRLKNQKRLVLLSYLFSSTFLLLSRSPYFIRGLRRYFWGYYTHVGHLHHPFMLIFIFFMIASLYNLYKGFKTKESPIEKKQTKLVFIALALAYISIVDFLPAYGIKVYPFGHVTVTVLVSIMTYSIVKYQLLVITPALAAKTIIATMADSLIVTDTNGSISMVNQSALELSGYGKEEIVHKTADDLFTEKALFTSRRFQKMAKGDFLKGCDGIFLNKSGDEIPVNLSTSMMRDKNGQVIGIVGVVRDIRELRELQMQLIRSVQMAAVGQLGAGVAHELNNPLGGILGYVQFMLDKFERPGFSTEDFKIYRKYIRYIEKEATRCKKIVEDLLRFSRSPGSVKPWPLDISEAIKETLSIVGYQLRLKNIQVRTELKLKMPMVMGIAGQLQQVFTNLIINAEQAMPEGGKLIIKAENRPQDKVRIEVTDTGCGIPPENLERVFEPFFTTKIKEKGVGLGLSLSYQIIKAHKGDLEVTSTPAKGSVFIITLPVMKEREE